MKGITPCPPELRHYYSRHMPYVSAQPRVREDVLASLLERNASEHAAQQEWEAEWNRFGLASRLSEEVRCRGESQPLTSKVSSVCFVLRRRLRHHLLSLVMSCFL